MLTLSYFFAAILLPCMTVATSQQTPTPCAVFYAQVPEVVLKIAAGNISQSDVCKLATEKCSGQDVILQGNQLASVKNIIDKFCVTAQNATNSNRLLDNVQSMDSTSPFTMVSLAGLMLATTSLFGIAITPNSAIPVAKNKSLTSSISVAMKTTKYAIHQYFELFNLRGILLKINKAHELSTNIPCWARHVIIPYLSGAFSGRLQVVLPDMVSLDGVPYRESIKFYNLHKRSITCVVDYERRFSQQQYDFRYDGYPRSRVYSETFPMENHVQLSSSQVDKESQLPNWADEQVGRKALITLSDKLGGTLSSNFGIGITALISGYVLNVYFIQCVSKISFKSFAADFEEFSQVCPIGGPELVGFHLMSIGTIFLSSLFYLRPHVHGVQIVTDDKMTDMTSDMCIEAKTVAITVHKIFSAIILIITCVIISSFSPHIITRLIAISGLVNGCATLFIPMRNKILSLIVLIGEFMYTLGLTFTIVVWFYNSNI